jgi:phage repressor protein C with HTH and peptisase S24 domain
LEKHWPKLAEFFGVSESYVAFGTPEKMDPTEIVGEGETEELREFSWRLKVLALERPIEKAALAGRMGVPLERVEDWFHGRKKPRAREIRDLAALFNAEPEWLATGEGPRLKFMPLPTPQGFSSQEGVGAVPVREVPVISWAHAGTAATYEEMPRHFHGKVATSSRGRRVYGLRVEGDSMIPRYNPGDIVILDADGEPRNGKGVVVKFSNDAVQIRLYHKLSNGKIRLTSTRPEIYPTDDYNPEDFHWIHPVLQTVRDE